MRTVATIGVYGFTVEMFLARLREAGVGVLVDVRQRRGVRGSEYAWANSTRLQAALAEADIEYRHRKELAPTTELRQLQYREDDRQGVGKRSRTQLAREYRDRYIAEILDRADLDAVVAEFPTDRATALMCVERDPERLPSLADCGASGRAVRARGAPPTSQLTVSGAAASLERVLPSSRAPARVVQSRVVSESMATVIARTSGTSSPAATSTP